MSRNAIPACGSPEGAANSPSPIASPENELSELHSKVDTQNLKVLESGQPISADSDLLQDLDVDIEDLDCTHMRISDLRALGLRRFTKLKTVGFRQNLLTTLHGIEELPPDLESLELYDNRLEHMDKRLEHFGPQMTSLDLSFNNFRHIKHLQTMTGLTDLYLCQNDISKIQNIEMLTKLTNLELGANRIRKIENLDALVNLEKLWIAKNKITKIENLDKLVNLKLLSIQSNRITKIEGLEKLVKLEGLYISHNGIETISGLESNLNLNTLDISNNRIATLTGIKHLTNLEELWAGYNKLSDFNELSSELGALPELHTVYFEHNPLQSENQTTYNNKVKLALGPNLKQIDANPVRQ